MHPKTKFHHFICTFFCGACTHAFMHTDDFHDKSWAGNEKRNEMQKTSLIIIMPVMKLVLLSVCRGEKDGNSLYVSMCIRSMY